MTPDQPNHRVTRRLRVLTVVVGVLLGLAVALSLKFLSTSVHSSGPLGTNEADYGLWTMGPCYRVEHDRLVRIPAPHRPPSGSNDFPLLKAAGIRRIAVVGESTGEMLENAMTQLVHSDGCNGRVEVLECSTFGAHPLLAVRRAREVMSYSPDVLVVAIGHNFRVPIGGISPEASSGDVPSMARDAYVQIVEAARAHGVQVVALQLPSNLLYRPRSDPEYLSSSGRAAAWVRWARGDLAGAAAALETGWRSDSALRVFERATFRANAGDWTGAHADYVLARDLDLCVPGDPPGGCAYRASSAVNAAIAGVVRAAGGTVIDVDALFSGGAAHGIVAWDTIWDYCHPNAAPLEPLARSVLAAATPDYRASCPAVETRESSATDAGPVIEADFLATTPTPFAIGAIAHPEQLGWTVFPDNAGWRRRVDGPVAALLRSSPLGAADILDRYDRETLSRFDAASHAAGIAAIGAQARDSGRLDLARWCLERSVHVAPAAPVLVDLAYLHLRLKEEAAARADLEAALQLNPSDAQVLRTRDAMFEEAPRRDQ